MTVPPARLALLAACLAAVSGPMLIGTVAPSAGDVASILVRLATALLALGLLLRKRPPGLAAPRASTRLFALALLVASGAAVLAVLSTAGVGSKALADTVYLFHAPFALAGLLFLPVSDARLGARLRGLLDGLVAAASLAFVLQLLVPALQSRAASSQIVLLATADVFVLATALSLLPRVVPELRRYLFLTSSGLVLIGAANLQKAIALSEGPVSSHGLRTAVLELGVLLVAAGAARPVTPDNGVHGWRWAALAPFVPTAVALLVAAQVMVRGAPMAADVGVVILACIALLLRQGVASWDSAQLLETLRRREHSYRDQAMLDPLTGLPNRRAFVAQLERAVAADQALTLLLVDCDDFKSINDTQGHDAGDAVLRHVGRQMSAAVAGRGTVARLGGDEFGVLLQLGTEASREVADELRAAAAAPVDTARRSTTLTVSIGGATASGSGDVASALLAHADVALYQVKGGRHDGVQVLDAAGRVEAAGHLRLRDDVATPDLSQFRVLYQPVFTAQTGALHGVEALLRWEHPELGPISPAVFIPLAEQTGAIHALGDFVLEQSLTQVAQWRRAHPGQHLTVGVNVSPHQLSEQSFAKRALGLLAAHRLEPSQLVVEITEQAFVSDLEPIAAVARTLRCTGVSIAVDDFGTGYASLRYLECIPTDVLKIDRAYIAGITDSPEVLSLVRGVLALAREIGLQSIGEGVETPEQLALLRELGCDVVQGYLLARPDGPEAVSALLAQAQARVTASGAGVVLPLARKSEPDATHAGR